MGNVWAGRAWIAIGVAALAFVARLLPMFVLPSDLADRWIRLVAGDPSNGMGFAIAARWMFLEVPFFAPLGIALIWLGIREISR